MFHRITVNRLAIPKIMWMGMNELKGIVHFEMKKSRPKRKTNINAETQAIWLIPSISKCIHVHLYMRYDIILYVLIFHSYLDCTHTLYIGTLLYHPINTEALSRFGKSHSHKTHRHSNTNSRNIFVDSSYKNQKIWTSQFHRKNQN